LAVLLTFSAGAATERLLASADPPAPALEPDFSLIREAWDTINKVFVDRPALQSKALTYGAVSGMVDALGDTGHSAFLTPDMVKQERSFIRGRYVGVGLEIEMKLGQVTIVAPLDNSPAFAAGLHSGEVIVKVDGSSVSGLPLDQVVQRIIGPAGTPVILTILDPVSHQSFDVTLKRAEITVTNVSWQPVPGYAVADLRIGAFSAGVAKAVTEALTEIQRESFAGIILDLRNDPGGELEEAVGAASQFLQGGNVLLEKNSDGEVNADRVLPGGVATSIPLVVLINGGTASGAEIVAGALQDGRRAPLVGETTFGTGTVLQYFKLSDDSELLLAVKEWLTPLGRTIWHKGIVPDLAVVLPPEADMVTPGVLKGMTAAAFQASGDVQLRTGVETLMKKLKAPVGAPFQTVAGPVVNSGK
jgi:carboxyl-terminal processing protease